MPGCITNNSRKHKKRGHSYFPAECSKKTIKGTFLFSSTTEEPLNVTSTFFTKMPADTKKGDIHLFQQNDHRPEAQCRAA